MTSVQSATRSPWNKGKLVGQKVPLRVRDVWAIRTRLQLQERVRNLALFNLGIDRSCAAVTSSVFEFVTLGMGMPLHLVR